MGASRRSRKTSGPHAEPEGDPDDLSQDPNVANCWDRAGDGLFAGDHGLWTAGIIGATGTAATFAGGNIGRVGFTGVSPTVRIRAIRVLDVSGSGENFDIAQGILYAAGLAANAGGCKLQSPTVGGGGCTDQAASSTNLVSTTMSPIINMSFGGPDADPTLQAAISAASGQGCLLVASAANDASSDVEYPAGYSTTIANVMAVAAVGPSGRIASYSNYGLDISVSPRQEEISSSTTTTTAAAGSGTRGGTSSTASPALHRRRNVSLRAVRLRDRGAHARADAGSFRCVPSVADPTVRASIFRHAAQ